MGNIVAIVGRPNVGKSTFFNRLIGERKAIIHESSGVTRDRHYGHSDWNGVEFSVIDTGGYVPKTTDIFEEEIKKQVLIAIDEADVIIFINDVLTGLTDMDLEVARILQKTKKKVVPVINKVDNSQRIYDAQEFYALGLGEIFCISSINGGGTGELLDEVVKSFPKTEQQEEEEVDLPKIAIVGRPNVGKSSLANALLDQERNIVTPVSGTTRDTLYSRYSKFGHDFLLVDTAGLRKKGKVHEEIEFYSTIRSIRAIESSDVCMLLIDANEGVEAQDINIFQVIQKNNKGVIILVNKWDLIEKENDSVKKYTEIIKNKIAPFNDVPILFISALTKQRVFKALETAIEVFDRKGKKIPTSKLNDVILKEIEINPPPAVKGKYIKIKFATQLPTRYPAFAFFCNLPQYVKEPYKRFLENRIREHFDFEGVPIKVFMRKK